MRYAITGPVEITSADVDFVLSVLARELDTEVTEFTSGAAFGVDTVGAQGAEEAGVPLIRLTVPAAYHNAELVKRGKELGWVIEVMDMGPMRDSSRFNSRAYMVRNDATIAHTDVLLAFPPTSREVLRGQGGSAGTWATVRRARNKGREIHFYPLDGSAPWTENVL